MRDRATGRVNTEVVEFTDKPTLQNFVVRHTTRSTTVYSDEARAYVGLPRPHEAVKHSVKEYVNGQAPTLTGWKATGRCSRGDMSAYTTR